MLCGYPLCDITLADIPKQQYIISKTQNKVFDITERKKFCSNKCYKSSVYLKEQILTTPLWVRKEDDILPEFKLLSFDDKDTNIEDENKNKDVDKGEDKVEDVNEEEKPNPNESSNNSNAWFSQIYLDLAVFFNAITDLH